MILLIYRQKLEKCGNTGNSTGTHLHLELSTSQAWQCGNFLNPVEPLGIPNIRGTIVHYNGEIPPIPPTPTERKASNWLKIKCKKININT